MVQGPTANPYGCKGPQHCFNTNHSFLYKDLLVGTRWGPHVLMCKDMITTPVPPLQGRSCKISEVGLRVSLPLSSLSSFLLNFSVLSKKSRKGEGEGRATARSSGFAQARSTSNNPGGNKKTYKKAYFLILYEGKSQSTTLAHVVLGLEPRALCLRYPSFTHSAKSWLSHWVISKHASPLDRHREPPRGVKSTTAHPLESFFLIFFLPYNFYFSV